MLSTLLRTIPAISLDVMAADFATAPQTLASLTSIYHFAFAASQIPVGAALMQSTTGVVATLYGLPAVLLFMAAALVAGTVVFVAYTQLSKS
jgi:hypothetical protein